MADTTIKITEEVRDRLRLLAEERGLSTRAFVERLAVSMPTEAERAERTARGVAYVRANLGVDLTDRDVEEAQEWRAAIVAGRVGSRR
ncbi:ribbon-helix-helix domain-containing protein [Streptomyces sannanensis]|uniref:Ribbon-helix-helix domain-containing protein n=1 Tax=Streptomyces sannanensis TaxID=285536 RepID=A0ABP6SIX6_9ACTN